MSEYGTFSETSRPQQRLRHSKSDRMIAGVCGGIATLLEVDPTLIRILLVAATVLGFGSGLVIYLICWILMPLEA